MSRDFSRREAGIAAVEERCSQQQVCLAVGGVRVHVRTQILHGLAIAALLVQGVGARESAVFSLILAGAQSEQKYQGE